MYIQSMPQYLKLYIQGEMTKPGELMHALFHIITSFLLRKHYINSISIYQDYIMLTM